MYKIYLESDKKHSKYLELCKKMYTLAEKFQSIVNIYEKNLVSYLSWF